MTTISPAPAPTAASPAPATAGPPRALRGAGTLGRTILWRFLGRLILVLFGVLTVLFLMLHVAGNPAEALAGADSTPAEVARISHQLGFDRPLITQYGSFLWDAVRFDFGQSYQQHTDAVGVVLDRLPQTLGLIGLAYLFALLVALPLGLAAGLTRSRIYSGLMDLVVLAGQAVPVFATGVILVYLFAVELGVVPAIASNGFSSPPSAIVLPVVVLALYPIARIVEIVRAGLHESMQEDFVRTAEAKGARPWRVVSRHAVRPVLTSLCTVVGVDLAQMLSGGVLVEVIFAWPGVGPLLVSSVPNRDYPVVAAATYCFAVIVVLINLVMDLLYRWLDPRIRVKGGGK